MPWRETQPRRKHGGGGPVDRGESANAHGSRVLKQIESVSLALKARITSAPTGINPELVFKLKLHAKGRLDDGQLEQLGLHVLERDPERTIVVFPDDESLAELRRRMEEYAGLQEGGHQYSYLSAIDEIGQLGPDDRTGRRLKESPLGEGEIASLDVELFHTGDAERCRDMVKEVRGLVESRGLSVTDSWTGDSMILLRARLNVDALSLLLMVDYVREVERRPEPSFEMDSIRTLDVDDVDVADILTRDTPGILVVDSGITSGHPLLRMAVGDAQVFPDRLRERVTEGPEDSGYGHGTAVAGLAVYGDLVHMMDSGNFRPTAVVFSARVTNEHGEYDPDSLIEHQLEEALRYFLTAYPSIKVVNISLGARDFVCRDDQLQFRFAAAIDELAYGYRNQNVVFVVSAGNYWPTDLSDEDLLRGYPDYLTNTDLSRVIDPGTSAIALTVGGLSYGPAEQPSLINGGSTDRLIVSTRAHPSSFTRTGWGLGGAIKPDVVDFAGDQRFVRGDIHPDPAQYAGVPTTASNFAPPDGRLLRTVAGTSFAAPRVSNIASRLFDHFPDASSNLVRALLAASASVPDDRPGLLAGLRDWDDEVLKLYGYGQPNLDAARWSAYNAVLLVGDSTLELDHLCLYELPTLPNDFFGAQGSGRISVCLAFDPPTRRSRVDYLGVRMQFRLFRNVTSEQVARALTSATNEELEDEEEGATVAAMQRAAGVPIDIDLKPKMRRRSYGTLQRGMARITSSRWDYDGNPLVLAVVCRRVWAPEDISEQRYAIVVTLEHDQPHVDLYNHALLQTRVLQRVRVRA